MRVLQLNKHTLIAFLFCALVLGQSAAASPQTSQRRLYEVAGQSLGKELWKPGYGLSVGTLGCAAAVCNVLKKAGVTKVSSPVVTVMRRQLLSKGCREFIVRDGDGKKAINDQMLLKHSRPGDILIATMEPPSRLNGGGNAHCGIMAKGLQIYTNDWNNGIWSEVNVHQMFDTYPYVRLLRLPQ